MVLPGRTPVKKSYDDNAKSIRLNIVYGAGMFGVGPKPALIFGFLSSKKQLQGCAERRMVHLILAFLVLTTAFCNAAADERIVIGQAQSIHSAAVNEDR